MHVSNVFSLPQTIPLCYGKKVSQHPRSHTPHCGKSKKLLELTAKQTNTNTYRLGTEVYRLVRQMQRRQVDVQSPISKETEVVQVNGIASFVLGTRKYELFYG